LATSSSEPNNMVETAIRPDNTPPSRRRPCWRSAGHRGAGMTDPSKGPKPMIDSTPLADIHRMIGSLSEVCCRTMAFARPRTRRRGTMLQRMVTAARRLCEAPKLPSSRHTSRMFPVGTDVDLTRVTLALDQAAAAVRRSAAESRRTVFLERRPRPIWKAK